MILLRLPLIILTIGMVFLAQAQSITCMGNAGVFIQNGESKVFIDALFDEYNTKFHAPSANEMTKIMTQTAPYKGVDLVLVTHAHRDHFKGQIGVDYLKANKDARMVAPPQALDSMRLYPETFNTVSSRVTSFPWKKGWKQVTIGDINVKTTYMWHAGKSNRKVQNAIYVVSMGGKKIIHLGDTQMERDNFDNLRLEYEEFDAAIIPFWYLTNVYGASLVRKFAKSKKIIAIRLPKTGNEGMITKIKENFPDAVIFTQPGKKISF